MALATYGDLKASVASWLGRTDLSTPIVDFVTLAHKQLMRDLRGHLRLQKRDTAFSIATEYVAAPADFLELVSMHLNTSPRVAITLGAPDDMSRLDSSGQPVYVSLAGATTAGTETFRFAPPPAGTYTATIEYYAGLTFFGSDAATNWILTDHPQLYLYGSLLQSAAYIENDARVPLWQAAYAEALAAVKAEGRRARWGANGMQVRVA